MWGVELQRGSGVPLKRQIYQILSISITEGRIPADEALPSTRELAKQLGISRNTVCEAYEMLATEGFVSSRQGSAIRVSKGLAIETIPNSDRRTLPEVPIYTADFKTGQPDLRCFPQLLWNQISKKSIEEMPRELLGYSGPEGLQSLRQEIAAWLFRTKGLTVSFQDIFITAGATQALNLIADLLCQKDNGILIEDPCHIGMFRTIQSKGYPVYPVPVDFQGICVDHLDENVAAALYVTASHQFPLGGILPANRRAALIRYAREHDLYLIEDDYDSEFRYCGDSVAPLFSMDTQRVIYVGTFSKILFPALRIGYVILPPHLHKQWRYLRMHTDVQNPPFEQAALAEFLRTRKLDRHVRTMRKIYGDRRNVLLQSLGEHFGSAWQPWGDAAGLHLAVEFFGLNFDSDFINRCRQRGIRLASVDYHCIQKGTHTDKLLLGYGHLEPEEIRAAVLALHTLMEEEHSHTV